MRCRTLLAVTGRLHKVEIVRSIPNGEGIASIKRGKVPTNPRFRILEASEYAECSALFPGLLLLCLAFQDEEPGFDPLLLVEVQSLKILGVPELFDGAGGVAE